MKQWIKSLPAKIICFIMCIVFLSVTVASVFGAVVMAVSGFYTDSKNYKLQQATYSTFVGDAYNIIYYELDTDGSYSNRFEYKNFSAGVTNLRYQLIDANGNVVSKNIDKKLSVDDSIWKYFYSAEVKTDEDGRWIEFLGNEAIESQENTYVLCAYLEGELPVDDEYALITKLVNIGYALRYWIYPIGILSLILTVACFVTLMCVSGRRPYSDELHPGLLNRIPIDLLTVSPAILFIFLYELAENVFYTGEIALSIMLIISVVFAVIIFVGLCMSIAVRIKEKTLFTNTVIFRIFKFARKIFKLLYKWAKKAAKLIATAFLNIPMIWRTAAVLAAVTFVEGCVLILNWYETDNIVLFWIAEKFIFVPFVIYSAIFLRKLQKGGEALAKGEIGYQVDTGMMFWDFKRHGENLNSIADGMAVAVEERISSERMKTELITNVSHDIKTPLTSIINYAGLIEKESCTCEHHKEYSGVLVRKSEHLKRLLDDLVEISKASTGNLEVILSPCEAGVLLTQAAGEFEQRCNAAGLQLITGQPEKSVKIMADSRRIWRVFENLMSNACKYSLPGSRVYLTLDTIDNEAVFTFRNTSRTALNISPDELMERFVRGDASRSTEGNGLGLSIAKSLTELQKGKMDITIDGDLFKVTISFPCI